MTGLTAQDMCKVISKQLWIQGGSWIKPKSVFNYSPTGELWLMFVLYDWAKKYES